MTTIANDPKSLIKRLEIFQTGKPSTVCNLNTMFLENAEMFTIQVESCHTNQTPQINSVTEAYCQVLRRPDVGVLDENITEQPAIPYTEFKPQLPRSVAEIFFQLKAFCVNFDGLDVTINENFEMLISVSLAFGSQHYLKFNPAIAQMLNIPEYIYIPTLSLVEYTKSLGVPVICFPRGIKDYKNFCEIVKPDAVNIDYDVDPKEIINTIQIPVQGGLDPKFLLADKDILEKEIKKYLNIFKDHPYIFNLGHGIQPQTKIEMVEKLVKIVRSFN